MPIANCDARLPIRLFASAITDCKPSSQALVTCDRMWVKRERRVANCRDHAVQRDEKPRALRTLLLFPPLESRLRSNAQVRKQLLRWLTGYS